MVLFPICLISLVPFYSRNSLVVFPKWLFPPASEHGPSNGFVSMTSWGLPWQFLSALRHFEDSFTVPPPPSPFPGSSSLTSRCRLTGTFLSWLSRSPLRSCFWGLFRSGECDYGVLPVGLFRPTLITTELEPNSFSFWLFPFFLSPSPVLRSSSVKTVWCRGPPDSGACSPPCALERFLVHLVTVAF